MRLAPLSTPNTKPLTGSTATACGQLAPKAPGNNVGVAPVSSITAMDPAAGAPSWPPVLATNTRRWTGSTAKATGELVVGIEASRPSSRLYTTTRLSATKDTKTCPVAESTATV